MSTPANLQLTQIIAKAIHETDLRARLIADPKETLHSMNVYIPDEQNVTVLESNEKQSFFILPIMTHDDIEKLKIELNSLRPQRSVRSRILIKASQDLEFKAQLISNPKAVLNAEGMSIPEATTLQVFENSSSQLYIVLPYLCSHSHK